MAEIKKWLGLRNTTSPERYKLGELEVAQNVEIDDTGKLRSRAGFTSVSATASHSLWADGDICLVVQGQTLKRMNTDATLTSVKALLSNAPVAYRRVQNVVYYSNGVDSGRVTPTGWSQWGITPPVGQPVATATAGSLPAGRYMFALTFVRNDGHESGTGLAGVIDIPYNGGISFSRIETSQNPEISGKMIYLSSPNGEVMYRAAVLAADASSYVYRNAAMDTTVPLTTQFAGPPPAGTIVEYYNGAMYVASGNAAFYSDPYALELFRPDTSFLQFPAGITMLAAVNKGLFCSAGRTWFLSGDRPDKLESNLLFEYGAVPGTVVTTGQALFGRIDPISGEEPPQPIVIWTSDRGVCIGFDDGTAKNLTESRYSFPTARRGAGCIRGTRGFFQYLLVLQGSSVPAHNAYS